MENRKIPALFALAGIVIAVIVFFFVANDDTADQESETTQTAATSTTTDETGDDKDEPDEQKPEKPAEPRCLSSRSAMARRSVASLEVEVTEGDELRIDVTTDAPDELHLHTYDVYLDVVPGKTNELVVESADIGGVFELESHTTGALLAEISVVPG